MAVMNRRQFLALGLACAATSAQAQMPVARDLKTPEDDMFDKLLSRISGKDIKAKPNNNGLRRSVYESELGEFDLRFAGIEDIQIEVLAFERDFAPAGAEDNGYVLLTNGMSDRRMTMPSQASPSDGKARAELMWYVREPTDEIIATMRWLAKFPFIDSIWLGFGHRVPMPEQPLKDCDFKTFLFLTPIIEPDKQIAEALSIEGEPVEILTVNLISDAEYALIKARGLNPFLDLLDENDYPPIFDPTRKSYV